MLFKDKVIKFHMAIGINNAVQSDEYPLSDFITETEWSIIGEKEKSEYLQKWADDWSQNYLDLGASVDE